MWIRRFLIACFLLIVAGLYAEPATARLDEKRSAPDNCPMTFDLPVAVECGMVSVPEDHRHPGGPKIQIAYARLISTAADPAPDPILIITGGPGDPALLDIEHVTPHLAPLIAQQDVILFDQRGVGFSQPGVDCPEQTALDIELYRGQSPSRVEAARACYQRLSATGMNLSVYTTPQVAADIPYLVKALGYETWNVYGVSYGTLVALVLMDQQPAGLRSVVLDSVLDPDADMIGDRAGLGTASFANFFRSCEADWLCRIAYPDLEMAYNQAVDRLNAEPATRILPDPQTNQPVTLRVDGAVFPYVAADLLNTDKGRAALPGVIYAGRDGLVKGLLDWHEDQYNHFLETVGVPGSAGNGMAISVICADFAPRADLNAVPEVERFPVRGATYVMIESCLGWTTEGSDALPGARVRSNIPTLILSGDYDSQTPPSYAQHAAETLPSSQVVRFPRLGHGVLSSGEQCPFEIVDAFYDQPRARVETGCVGHQRGAPLIITAGVTRSLARWVILPLFALAGIAIIVMTGGEMVRLVARRQTAFRNAARRNIWLGVLLSGAILSGSLVSLEHPLDAIVTTIPPMIAVQIALLTAPEEEPYLEILLACPRPFCWILVERWLVITVLQILVAALGIAASALFMHDGDIAYVLTQTIPPTLLLAGLGAFVSARSKSTSLGVIVALMGSGFWAVGNNILLITGMETPLPRPFDLVQSLLWMVHPFLKPDSFIPMDYFANRIIVAGIGLALLGWAATLLNNTEFLLTGTRAGWLRKRISQ